MPNSATEQLHITDYKISGFNVVVTMPDGQVKVLKDGLADIMLGNIVLIDKNGQPITKEMVLDHVNVKQNALDSAFLGDFIKNKSNEPSEETDGQPDNKAVAKEEILQSIIKELDHQLGEFKLNTSEATAQIDELSTKNQANLKIISNYLQQLNQAKAEVDILRQEAMEKTVQLQSIKEQLPAQNLAEAFKPRPQENTDISNAQPYATAKPVPVSKATPSSSASSPAEDDNRIRLEDNQAAIDKTELEKLTAEAARTKLEDNQAAIDKEELARLKETVLKENEAAIDKEELTRLKELENHTVLEENEAAIDKTELEKLKELDKVTSGIQDALSKLGSSDFISPDFHIDAKLDSNSDLGNSLPASRSDNITNITTPTFIGEASKGTKVRILISTGKEGDAALVNTEIDVHDVEGERYGVWSYTVPDSLMLTPGAYHFSATAYKSQETNINGETKILTESSLPKTGTFVIDTELPSAAITTISDSQFNADSGWLTGTITPTFSGATKANSDVTLKITSKDDPTTAIFTGTATSSGTGSWAITVPETVIPNSGDYHYWLTVTDSAGNTNNSDETLTIDSESLISTLQLAKDSDSGAKDDWQTNITTPTFEGVATKNNLPVSHVKVKITINGKEYEGISGDDGKWSVTVTDPVTIVGNQSVSLVATDALGKTFTTSHFININNTSPSVDASLTTETDTGTSHTDGITSSIAPVLHGTTTPGSKVTLTVYYNPLGSGYSTIDENSYKHVETFDTSTGSWSYKVPISAIYNELVTKYTSAPSSGGSYLFNVPGHSHDGVYNYTISVKDALDNEATSDLKSWTIDTVAPAIEVAVSNTDINPNPPTALIGDHFVLRTTKPTLTITSEIGSKVTITYPGADGTEGHPAASGFTVDNGAGNGVATIKLNAPISTYLDGVAESGTKALITVEDQAGNVSTQTVHLKFVPSTDITVPISVHLLEADDSGSSNTDGITNNTQPRLTGTTVAGATVELTISPNGQPPYTIEVPKSAFNTAGTEWTIRLPHLLPNGVSVYTATASLDGNKSSISGSLQIDTAAPELTELTLGGPKIGYVNNDWTSGKPVEWNQVGWNRETNTITFSTGIKLRQQGAATFIGALSESATISAHNVMVRHPKTGNAREYDNEGITWTNTNPSTGQPTLNMAVGFNYRQDNLTDAAAKKLQEEHIRPSGWAWGDLKTTDELSIYGLGFEGFKGRWDLNESTMTLTDLAGNSRTYHIHVQYNSVGPTVENIHIVNTADSDGPYNGDTRTNNGLGQNLYIKDLSGFAIAGTQIGAKEVVLVDVSNRSDEWLANANNRYSAATDKTATRYVGTLNADGSWGVTYVANARPGALSVIKVIPVLTNPVGQPQDNLSYLKINILQQDYTSSTDLDPSTDTGILGDHITSNVQPILTGTIANYNPTVTATISIAGQAAQALTIAPGGVWSYSLPNALVVNTTYNYTVTINDKYGNSSQVHSHFTIVGQISGALNPTEMDDTGVIGDGITSNTRPVLIGTVEAGSTARVSYNDLSGKTHTVSISTETDGKWKGRITETLSDGLYEFTVSQLDTGNRETARQTFHFTIDTTPPTVTTELDKTFFSALARNKDGVVFNNDPVLKGTVESTVNGSTHGEGNRPLTVTIPVKIDGKTVNYVYQTTTSIDGSWQISLNSSSIINKNLPALPDGSYTYSVIGEDVAGNKASPVNGSFTLDTTPPERLEFGVKDNKLHSDEKGDGMTLYTTAFTNSQIFGKVNPGERIKIIFTGVGSTGKNTEAKVDGFTGYDVPDSLITMDSATGVWSARLQDLKSVTVNRYREQITPDGNVTLIPSGTTVNPDGAYYTAEIIAIDDAGNTRSVKVNYELGKLPPTTTSMVFTPDGEFIGHSITATQQPVFTGNTRSGATVTLNLSSSIQIKPTLNDLKEKQTFTTTADEKGNWRIEIDESNMLKAGFYYYSFTVTDENGLSDTIGYIGMGGKHNGTKYFLNVDLTPVGVEAELDPTNDSGINNDHITNITHQKILGSAQTFTSEINIYVSDTPFDMKKPGGTLISSTSSGETVPEPNLLRDKVTHMPFVPFGSENGWYMDITGTDGAPLADGTYYYRIEASNFIGRTENKYIHFTIDTTPPKLDVVSLAVESDTGIIGDRITAQTGPVLTGRSEPGATITVHVEEKTDTWHEITTKVEDNGEWRVTMPDFSAGKHRYWVEAVDIAGNKTVRGTVSDTVVEPLTEDYYFIQNVYTGSNTPITSNLDLTSDTGLRDYITSNNTPTISGTAPLVLNTVNGKTSEVFLDIVVNGITQTYSGFNDGRGNYSIKITKPLPNGFYKYKVYTADAAGNKSTIYDSPDNLSVRGTDGKVNKYTFQVQRDTSYEDLGLKDTSAFNITAATAVSLHGKIRLSGSLDKAENYTVSVAVTDINSDGRPRTLTANTAVDKDGSWSTTGSLISMATRGIHTYTVTINDKKTGTNTTYSNTFTVLAETSTTTTANDTLAEQQGNLPKFSGTAPGKTKFIKLNIFDSSGNQAGTEKEIAVDSSTGKWSYTWSKDDSELLDGEYSYTLRTVNIADQVSTNFISGSLEIYTTPPVLNYVEQDTRVAQDGSITMTPGVLFHGYVDVNKGKYAKNLPSTQNELPADTVTVKFQDFTINPLVNKTTGRWEITQADYEKQMTSSGGNIENNTAYTVTLKDRFGNTTTDSGDLAPNNDHNGDSHRPLFMGEADPGATITVVVKNTSTSVSDTARTTAGEDGHWEVSWSRDLPTGTYEYSLNVVSTSGANYNTGNLGSITIAATNPQPKDIAPATADLLSATDAAPAEMPAGPEAAEVDALFRAAVELADTTAIDHHEERFAA